MSAPTCLYCAIALDIDMASDPAWLRRVLTLSAKRADVGAVSSLPLRSFDMETQYELAFRALQGGLNTGKIVVRIAARKAASVSGAHLVTGGTSGLGLLTGRWIAQRGGTELILASRSGKLAADTIVEWEVVQASGTIATLAVCDVGEVAHARRLVARKGDGSERLVGLQLGDERLTAR